MNISIHLIIRGSDEIFGVVGDRAAGVGPMLQLYNQDMVGGPVSISFGEGSKPAEGSDVVDRLIRELMVVRNELDARIVGRRPILAIAGAGDPEGESSDAPVLDEQR